MTGLPTSISGTAPAMGSLRAARVRFSGYFVLVGGTAISRLLAFLAAVVVARELGPSRFGEMSVFLAVLTFWMGSDFIDLTYVRHASATRDEATRERYLRAALFLKVAWNLLLAISALPVAWAISHLLLGKPVLFPAIALALACGVALNCLSLRAAMFQSQERFLCFTATSSAFYLLSFVLVGALSLTTSEPDTTWFFGAYLVSAAALGAYGCVSVLRAAQHLVFERDTVRSLARFSRWLFGANIGGLITERLDLFLLAGFASLTAVGEYGAAFRVVAIVSLLTGTLAPVLLPRAARARQSPALLRSYLRHGAVLSAMISVLVGALWLATPLVVRTLFGGAYDGAAPLVRIILVGTLCIAIYTPLSQLFLVDGQPRRMLYLTLLRLGLTLAVGSVLIARFGAHGAAVTMALVEVAALVYVTVSVRDQLIAALWPRQAGNVTAADAAQRPSGRATIAMVSNALDPPPDEGIKKCAQQLAAVLRSVGAAVYPVTAGESLAARKLLLSPRVLWHLRESQVRAVIYLPTQSATVASLIRSRVLRSLAGTKVLMVSLQPRDLKPMPRIVTRWLGPDLLVSPDPVMVHAAEQRGLDAAFLQIGVDVERFRPVDPLRKRELRRKHGLPSEQPVALHVGHARWSRGLGWLVDLGDDLVPVVVIGHSLGVDPAVVRSLRRSGVRVIDDYLPAIQEIYQLADVYLFPVQDTQSASAAPLSVFEAMACNLPVVSTRFGSLSELFADGEGLFFVNDEPAFRRQVPAALRLAPEAVRTRERVLALSWQAAGENLLRTADELCRTT